MPSIPRGLRDRARHLGRLASSAASFGLERLVRDDAGDAVLLGEALTAELDQLKGMAMKVGQILSYMDGSMPAEAQVALARLQRGTSPVPWEELRGALEAGLGAPVAELFDEVDPVAVAAASIGQVHRGVLQREPVAIKVQYPGVRETFETDVRQLRRIAGVASLATRVDGQAIVDDLRARLLEECDYAHEARWQQRMAGWFRDDARVVVPAVRDDRSCETVLTTTWCDGLPLEAFGDAPQAARDAAGATLARFAWRSLFVHGAIHADPHPGNQLFAHDHVVFLDFGCVRAFDPAWVASQRRELRALLDGDRAAFRAAVLDSGLVPQPARFDVDEHWAMQRHMWEPYLSTSYAFDGTWAARGARYSRPGNPNLLQLAIPPEWVWMVRLQWGLHAVLGRLRATGDFRALLEAALEATAVHPALP